jgi:multidrug efflux pump subunit AcrA (membrane-fusion protein)
MKVSRAGLMILLWISLTLSACDAYREKPLDETHKITVTTAQSKAVTLRQQYICRIRSGRHIGIQSLADGYLAAIPIRKGQTVKRDDDVAHQREVVIQNEVDDLFVVETGVGVNDRIVKDGVRIVRDGEKVRNVAMERIP